MDSCESPRPGPLPDIAADADVEWAQYTAWLDREAPAGSAPAGPVPAGPGRGGRCSPRTGRPT